jgi:hypothetical protein
VCFLARLYGRGFLSRDAWAYLICFQNHPQVLRMKDDELSPLDNAMEQISDVLRSLGVNDLDCADFVRNCPVTEAVF